MTMTPRLASTVPVLTPARVLLALIGVLSAATAAAAGASNVRRILDSKRKFQFVKVSHFGSAAAAIRD